MSSADTGITPVLVADLQAGPSTAAPGGVAFSGPQVTSSAGSRSELALTGQSTVALIGLGALVIVVGLHLRVLAGRGGFAE